VGWPSSAGIALSSRTLDSFARLGVSTRLFVTGIRRLLSCSRESPRREVRGRARIGEEHRAVVPVEFLLGDISVPTCIAYLSCYPLGNGKTVRTLRIVFLILPVGVVPLVVVHLPHPSERCA